MIVRFLARLPRPRFTPCRDLTTGLYDEQERMPEHSRHALNNGRNNTPREPQRERNNTKRNDCCQPPSKNAKDIGCERDSYGDHNDPRKTYQHDDAHALTMLRSVSCWQRTNTEAPTAFFHIGLANMCP